MTAIPANKNQNGGIRRLRFLGKSASIAWHKSGRGEAAHGSSFSRMALPMSFLCSIAYIVRCWILCFHRVLQHCFGLMHVSLLRTSPNTKHLCNLLVRTIAEFLQTEHKPRMI